MDDQSAILLAAAVVEAERTEWALKIFRVDSSILNGKPEPAEMVAEETSLWGLI